MDFSIFAEKVTAQDNRNKFSKYDGSLDIVPDELKPFYCAYNPVDVEINSKIGTVHFYPVEGLLNLQREYAYLKAQFVFATCNSDPIFFNDGRLYTCPHGVNEPEWEPVCDPLLCLLIQSD